MIFKPFATAALLGAFALPAAAQETLILSICQDGLNGSASQTSEDLGRFLEGNWAMSAVGTGFTTGTNIMTVSLRYDEGQQALMMEGQGVSVALNPAIDDAGFDMSVEALTPAGLSNDELEVLTGCGKPTRYWWEFGSGNQRSWGALMFFENDAAVGFMANSAGGSRSVGLTRKP